MRIADCGTGNLKSEIRNPKLSSQASIDRVVLAQTANQQQSVEQKLPPVRCTIAPSKDAVRWKTTQSTPVGPARLIAPTTPVAPVSEKDKSTQRVESQTLDSSSHLAILNPGPPNADNNCGMPNVSCGTSNPEFGTRNSKLSSQASIDPVALAQTANRQQPVEPKLPSVRCTITPTKDAVRWRGTPVASVSEKDKSTQRVESQTPDSTSHLAILNANSDNDCGLRIADCGTNNPKSAIRNSKLSIQASIDRVVLAQTANQQQPVEPKLPSVRCTITPTKDAVRWRGTPTPPGTPVPPVAEKDKSTQRVESQTPDSSRHLAILNANSLNGDNDCGMPNAKGGTDIPQSAIRNPQFNSDGWFQISTETPEPTDIQETVLTTSDGNKAGPQPLAQVLANLARDAERNFVDPGIPADETITYNFADSDLDPWEAFTRIAETRGYRIVYWGDVVTLTRNQQDPLSPVNPHRVKAEVWVWVDQSAKPRHDRRGLVLQLAGADITPNNKPQTVRSLEAGSKATISFIDAQSERGDSTLRLTVNPVLLPNGNIEAGLGIENAVPALDGHKGVTIRRNINHTLDLTPTKQVVEIDGILMPSSNDPGAGKRSWIQRLFRSKKAPEKSTARMVVKLTVEPVAGSQTPMPTDNPIRIPGSDSGKTGVVLAPGQVRRTPELTSIQTLKH